MVVKNKTAQKISLRIPRWADKPAVRGTINGAAVAPFWLGQYIVFDEVQPNDVLVVEFPMVESSATYTVGWGGIQIPGWTEVTLPLDQEKPSGPTDYQVSATLKGTKAALPVFTMHFKGNDLVDITPRESGLGYPLYERSHYKQHKAPLKKVTRFVGPTVIDI